MLIESVLAKFREGLLGKVGIGDDVLSDFSKEDLVYLIELFSKAMVEIKGAAIEELPVEIAVIRWCGDKKLEVRNKKIDEDTKEWATNKLQENVAKINSILDERSPQETL